MNEISSWFVFLGESGDMLAQGRNAKEVKFNQLRSKVTDLTAVLKELQAKNEHVGSKTSEQVGAVDLHLTLVSLSLNAFSSWSNQLPSVITLVESVYIARF